MLIIGDIAVDDAVTTQRFSCDLARCKGACCTLEGGRGAPLLDEEKALVERHYPAVRKYLSPGHIAAIERQGPVDGFPGAFATTCVEDRACVFVAYDGDIARCSFELAFRKGEIGWRKPVSCHLFPLRYSGGRAGVLRYEAIPECSAGRERGERDGTRLHDFLEDAIIRRLGPGWHTLLSEACETPAAGAEAPGVGEGSDDA